MRHRRLAVRALVRRPVPEELPGVEGRSARTGAVAFGRRQRCRTVFGAPRRQDDHADEAFAAALEIERAVADEFEGELSIGVGRNSGTVIAGNVGGAGRFEFSVIGDAVNVAARVEAATRKTGDTVLLSEQTRHLLSGNAAISLQERPTVPLKGKTRAVALYAPARTGSSGIH